MQIVSGPKPLTLDTGERLCWPRRNFGVKPRACHELTNELNLTSCAGLSVRETGHRWSALIGGTGMCPWGKLMGTLGGRWTGLSNADGNRYYDAVYDAHRILLGHKVVTSPRDSLTVRGGGREGRRVPKSRRRNVLHFLAMAKQ